MEKKILVSYLNGRLESLKAGEESTAINEINSLIDLVSKQPNSLRLERLEFLKGVLSKYPIGLVIELGNETFLCGLMDGSDKVSGFVNDGDTYLNDFDGTPIDGLTDGDLEYMFTEAINGQTIIDKLDQCLYEAKPESYYRECGELPKEYLSDLPNIRKVDGKLYDVTEYNNGVMTLVNINDDEDEFYDVDINSLSSDEFGFSDISDFLYDVANIIENYLTDNEKTTKRIS